MLSWFLSAARDRKKIMKESECTLHLSYKGKLLEKNTSEWNFNIANNLSIIWKQLTYLSHELWNWNVENLKIKICNVCKL